MTNTGHADSCLSTPSYSDKCEQSKKRSLKAWGCCCAYITKTGRERVLSNTISLNQKSAIEIFYPFLHASHNIKSIWLFSEDQTENAAITPPMSLVKGRLMSLVT